MNTNLSTRILIIHNNDFPSNEMGTTDEPPSIGDSLEGVTARAQVKNVAFKIRECLCSQGFKNVSVRPIDCLSQIEEMAKRDDIDVVFNLCESLNADPWMEVAIIKLMERGKIRFTGNTSLPLANCLNKFHCSELLKQAKINVPEGVLVSSLDALSSLKSLFGVHTQWIVKPNAEDGSTGIDFNSVVNGFSQLEQKVEELLFGPSKCKELIIQQYIEGREINLALLYSGQKYWSFSEIDFSGLKQDYPKILNYASKWLSDSHEFNFTPSSQAKIDPPLKRKMIQMAEKAASVLGINAYARFDFRISTEGIPYIIDINPNCDLDKDAGFTKSFAMRGISYDRIILSVIQGAHYPLHIANVSKRPLFSKLSQKNIESAMVSNGL